MNEEDGEHKSLGHPLLFDQSIIFGMGTYPEPHNNLDIAERQCPIIIVDALDHKFGFSSLNWSDV